MVLGRPVGPPALLAALLALVPLPPDRAAWALPDLRPEVNDVRIEEDQSVGAGDVAEGCAGGTSGRTLLRFGVRFWNVGDESLLIGAANCPDCRANPGAVCGDPRFVCSPADGHDHPHYDRFATYELLDVRGNVVARGAKVSFCVRETRCEDGSEPAFTCDEQGIRPRCYDYYDSGLGCQYIDVTHVPNARTRAFRIRVTLDPDRTLPDADRDNNVVEHPVPGCGDGEVDAREACDGGPGGGAACCSDDCTAMPAGATCRAATGPCDAAETCDGESAQCPAAGPPLDTPACRPGRLPCLERVCDGTSCAERPIPGYCVIADACIMAGTPGPEACTTCDPARAVDRWSSDFGTDPAGAVCGPGSSACLVRRCTTADGCQEVAVPGHCAIDGACVPEDARSPDGCGVCKTRYAWDRWTPFFAPDAAGLRCRLAAIHAASAACVPGTVRAMDRRLGKIAGFVARLERRGRRVDARRLQRSVERLREMAARRDCAVPHAGALPGQTFIYVQERIARGRRASS